MQPRLFDLLPEGFRYQEDLISPSEEQALLAWMERLPFAPFQFGPYEGLRRIVSFGHRYDYTDRGLRDEAPMPGILQDLRAQAAALAGMAPALFPQAMVTEYRPGAPIGWHRDRPDYAEVIGVSLLSPCTFRFRRRGADGWERRSLIAAPRSAYLLAGPSRGEWEHSIPPAPALRYSVTFRSLRPR